MTDPANQVISRLDKASPKGKDKWSAICPAHPDKNPSLSIAIGDDGRVLLKCWAGCAAIDVVKAIGLTMADLFPQQEKNHIRPGRQRIYPDYRMILRMISHELSVIVIAADRIYTGNTIDDRDMGTIGRAAGNIRRALEVSNAC